jgi:transcriptional regulator with XRE-family HTH domain
MGRTSGTGFPPDFGALIRRRRLELGLSMHDVADRCGYSVSNLAQIETAYIRHLPPPDKLTAIASSLGLKMATLLATAGYNVEGGAAGLTDDQQCKEAAEVEANRLRCLEIAAGLLRKSGDGAPVKEVIGTAAQLYEWARRPDSAFCDAP